MSSSLFHYLVFPFKGHLWSSSTPTDLSIFKKAPPNSPSDSDSTSHHRSVKPRRCATSTSYIMHVDTRSTDGLHIAISPAMTLTMRASGSRSWNANGLKTSMFTLVVEARGGSAAGGIDGEGSSACVRLAEIGQSMVYFMQSFGGDDHMLVLMVGILGSDGEAQWHSNGPLRLGKRNIYQVLLWQWHYERIWVLTVPFPDSTAGWWITTISPSIFQRWVQWKSLPTPKCDPYERSLVPPASTSPCWYSRTHP